MLLKSEFLASIGRIVGIKNAGDILGRLSLVDGTIIITLVESVKIEVSLRPRSPQPEIVAIVGIESRDRSVISHGNDFGAAFPVCPLGVTIPVGVGVAIEPNLVGDILPLNLPWITLSQPKIRNLTLVTIFKGLSEDTILISNTVAPGRNLKSGERIKEASGESSKTAISEGGILLLLVKLLEIVTHVHESRLEFILEIRVDQGILKSTTH